MNWKKPILPLKIYIKNSNYCETKCYDFCPFCGGLDIVYVNIPELKLKTRVCLLCNLLVNFDIKKLNKLILCYSKLPQSEIVKRTMCHYLTHGQIPKPFDIDNLVEKINLSPIIYLQLINYNLTNFVFFFSDLVNDMLGNDVSIFEDKIPFRSKYDLSFFEIPIHKITDNEQKILNKYEKKINKKIDFDSLRTFKIE
jgi:hypothetical protein